jgi:hypothetical protein
MADYASTHRDLVLTIMHRGTFDYIAPFVLSLRNTGYRGSIAILVSRVDRRSVKQLRELNIIIVPFRFSGRRHRQRLARFWPVWRWFFSTGVPHSLKIRLAHAVFHLYYRRHLLYLEFLEKHASDFDRVLLADGRDIFFQADPFAWNWTAGVHFFLEETGHQIQNCPAQRQWLIKQFGLSFLETHGQKTGACAGTTFGDMAGICQYLKLMAAITMQALDLRGVPEGDQGIHNYILIQNLMSNITIHENRRGPVLTMFHVREANIPTNASGAIVNEDGSIVPILHQYDRFPAMKERLLNSLPRTVCSADSGFSSHVPTSRRAVPV